MVSLADLLRSTWGHKAAACRDKDPNHFFPDRGRNSKAAKAICDTCPVVNACREYALSQPEVMNGVWGGMGEKEIRLERRRRREGREVA